MKLHEAMIEVLERHGGGWMDRDVIANEIAAGSLYVRPSDGLPPPSDQLRLRARSKSYAHLFECSDARCTKIRLASVGLVTSTTPEQHPDARQASVRQPVRTRTAPATGTVGGRANTLERLLVLAGRTIESPQFDRPTLGALPRQLRTEVLEVYRRLGGVQAEPQLHPGPWDAGCDGIAVELYAGMCAHHEVQCLSKGRSQARWTSPSTERQFGPPAARGDLTGNGAPRWKQRALYDFMKDLAPLAGFGTVARVSVWDALPVDGSEVLVEDLLRGSVEKKAAIAVSRLIDARATSPN